MENYHPPPVPSDQFRNIPKHYDYDKPPAEVVDRLLPMVQFSKRPLAYKIVIGFLFLGVGLCLGFVVFFVRIGASSVAISLILGLFILIGFLGIISIILLFIPKRIGWHLALTTAILALLGLGIGTLIGIFTIVGLMWPTTRYYFRTGEFPKKRHIDQDNYPYPQYPMMHEPFQQRK
jgi:hypothetical protein